MNSHLNDKWESVPEEKKKKIRKIVKITIVKLLFNGINFGALIAVSNLLLLMANETYFNSPLLLFIMCAIVDILLIKNSRKVIKEIENKTREKVKKILES